MSFFNGLSSISVDIATDGLPLFKGSSRLKLWPILGSISNRRDFQPFLIGIFTGSKDTSCSDEFLKEFCQDFTNIKEKGGVLLKNATNRIPLKLRLFCCDAPAKALITNVKNHASTSGCSK